MLHGVGLGHVPLRYGNKRFGYRHIEARHGYTPRTRRTIMNALRYQEIRGDRVTFRRYRKSVAETAVVSLRDVPRNAGRGKVGIITAYRARWDGEKKRGSIPNGNGNLYPYCNG
jgi:hypothetical protein